MVLGKAFVRHSAKVVALHGWPVATVGDAASMLGATHIRAGTGNRALFTTMHRTSPVSIEKSPHPLDIID